MPHTSHIPHATYTYFPHHTTPHTIHNLANPIIGEIHRARKVETLFGQRLNGIVARTKRPQVRDSTQGHTCPAMAHGSKFATSEHTQGSESIVGICSGDTRVTDVVKGTLSTMRIP